MGYDVQDFATEVLARSQQVPVLVDFWAPWCGPCRALGPVLERLAAEADGRWVLAKVNTEEAPDVAMRYGISSIPNVKLFRDGKVTDEFVGALPEREIRSWLAKALPSPQSDALAEARRLLAEGQTSAAASQLEPIHEKSPADEEAAVLLAEAVLGTEPQRVEPLLEFVDAASDFAAKADALRTLARVALQAEQPNALPNGAGRERYLVGGRAVKQADYAKALEAFIDVLGRDKNYAAGAARDGCKAIFQLLGIRHPLSERFYRAFTSSLYS